MPPIALKRPKVWSALKAFLFLHMTRMANERPLTVPLSQAVLRLMHNAPSYSHLISHHTLQVASAVNNGQTDAS